MACFSGRIFAGILLCLASSAPAGTKLQLPDKAAAARAEALIDRIDGELKTADSATLTLERWCAAQRMADPARIMVRRDRGAHKAPSAAQRSLLNISADEPVRYRKVRLVCGGHVLSEAENWYVPARLTPAMNAALDGSDEPFGKVVRPLSPTRQTLTDRRQWRGAPGKPRCDGTAFSHDALVLDKEGRPLALVEEHYRLELICAATGQ